ncbi:hypothetical protein KOW79_004287 [Hemibagrus wyckioides]|uniref:Uncharacterized protein n=1 Tax=Hemibagrus wyckioides TaxID=337641 RepID=A0A9D3P0N1_9TELE|nr:hypothetical protein KOW79_004287 [Hemibagrus wyckioides]
MTLCRKSVQSVVHNPDSASLIVLCSETAIPAQLQVQKSELKRSCISFSGALRKARAAHWFLLKRRASRRENVTTIHARSDLYTDASLSRILTSEKHRTPIS